MVRQFKSRVATRSNLVRGANFITAAGNIASHGKKMYDKHFGHKSQPYKKRKAPPAKEKKKTVNLEKKEGATNPHSIQLTKFNSYHPSKLAEYVKISPPAYYTWDDQQVYLGTQGQQYFYTLPRYMADYNQVETALNQSTSSQIIESQFFLEYIDQKTMITNFSSAVNELIIWELLVKDNLGPGFDPIQCIQAGYNAKFGVTGATFPLAIAGDPFLRPFANPLESTVLRQYYKVEKCQKVTLKPGECHKHHKYIQYNKIWKNTMGSSGGISGPGVNPVYIKGWTRLTMIQANGVCATDGAGGASITKVEHAVVQTTNLRYRTPQGKSSNTLQGRIAGTQLSSSIALVNTIAETGTRPAVI